MGMLTSLATCLICGRCRAIKALLTVSVLATLCQGQAQAQDSVLIAQLLDRVSKLERELSELRDQREGKAEPQLRSVSEPTRAQAPAEPFVSNAGGVSNTGGVSNSVSHSHDGGDTAPDVADDQLVAGPTVPGKLADAIRFRGFADIGYSTRRPETGTGSFAWGQIDLFATARLSPKLSFLLETVMEADHANNAAGIEVERVVLQYRHNRFLNVDMGRFHTNIGYFNTAYHHGRWFQTAIDRPAMFLLEDEGGVLPIHNVGLSVSGQLPSGALGLEYVAELANGRAYPGGGVVAVQNVRDENNGKAFNIALAARPRFAPGWQIGASYYRDRLVRDGASPVRQNIFSAHAVLINQRIEFLNEFLDLRHITESADNRGVKTGVKTSIPAFYSQFAWRLTPVWRPFVRYQYMNANSADPIARELIGPGILNHGWSVGLRHDLAEFVALKVQLDRLQYPGQPARNQAALNLAFSFPQD